jgi:hypothetical protein
MPLTLKITIAVSIILSTSWLSGKRPELAGFLTALPLVSILALAGLGVCLPNHKQCHYINT